MKNLEFNKEIFRRKVAPISLVVIMGVSMLGFTSCSKKEDTSKVKYVVEKSKKDKQQEKHDSVLSNYEVILSPSTENNKNYAEYDHYIDLGKLNIDEHLYRYISNHNTIGKDKEFVYPVGHLNYTTSMVDGVKLDSGAVTSSYFKTYSSIIWPDSLEWARKYYDDSNMYFNKAVTGQFVGEICLTEYRSLTGETYIYQESRLDIKNDIREKYLTMYDYDADDLNKDDYILNKSLYKINNDNSLVLIANKQEGVGSDSENVKGSIVNDLDTIFKPLSSLKYDENIEFSDKDELEDYLYDDEKKVKNK